MAVLNNGGYCGGVPPLHIPNREVKPAYADGTAMKCGRVGSRLRDHFFNNNSKFEIYEDIILEGVFLDEEGPK